MKRKPAEYVHASMPDGSEAVCTHYGRGRATAAREPRRTALTMVTCRACLRTLRAWPGLCNAIEAARNPLLSFDIGDAVPKAPEPPTPRISRI